MSRNTREANSSVWKKLIGWSCVVLGILGLILPIIPGIPFLIAGIATLSTQHRWARVVALWFRRRYRSIRPRLACSRSVGNTAEPD